MGIVDFYKKANTVKIEKVETPGTYRTVLVPGPKDVKDTPNTFYQSEANQFNYSSDVVIFDGTVRLKTNVLVNVSNPSIFMNGYFSESANIDISIFHVIDEVNIS